MPPKAKSLLIDYSRRSAVADGAISMRSKTLIQRRQEEDQRIEAGIPDCVFSIEQSYLPEKPNHSSYCPEKSEVTPLGCERIWWNEGTS